MTIVPMVWPVSCPLPATRSTSPLASIATASAIAAATVADLPRPARSGQHLAAYLGGVLAPRIVVGDDGEIGLGRRDTPHLGPLAFVAVAAAAEHDDETVLDIRAQSVERLEQSVRGMGIVDEDGRTGSRCAGQIESSEGAAQIRQYRQHGLRRSAGRQHEACGNQGVGRLEGADERKPHFILLALMLDDEVLGKAVRFGREQPQALAGASDGDEREPERHRFGGNRLAPLAVDIDDRAGAFAARARGTGGASARNTDRSSRDSPNGRARCW